MKILRRGCFRNNWKTVLFLGMSASLAQADSTPIEVQGHRGARGNRPENTLSAFKFALEAGVDVLELDLGVTKDDIVVVSHDPRINLDLCRLSEGKKPKTPYEKDPSSGKEIGPLIHSLSLEHLNEYDCGSLPNPRFPKQELHPGEKMPTLDQVLAFVGKYPGPVAKKVRFNIETKITPDHPKDTVTPKEFSKLVLDRVKKYGMSSRFVLQSFDYRTLVEARKLDPQVVIAALSEKLDEDLVETAKKLKANIISPYYKIIRTPIIERLHAMGVQVIPWTANDAEVWASLIEMKADGIITDYPKNLIEYLQSKGLRKK